jgi:methionyl-tRNA synthetase
MVERHNADLANGLGNLASRVLAMLASYFEGVIPAPGSADEESDLPKVIEDAVRRYDELMLEVSPSQAIAAVWEIVTRANQYLVEKEPWKAIKDESRRAEVGAVLYASAETLRILAVLIHPVMPRAAAELWSQLGIDALLDAQRLPEAARWGALAPGTKTTKGEALFPRLDS